MPLPLSCDFKKYRIDCLEVSLQREIPDCLELKPDIAYKPGKKSYKSMLVCKYNDKGVHFFAAIQGEFEFHEALNDTSVLNAWENGVTMLYGILRGLYTPLVSQCAGLIQYLPSYMMRNAIADRIQELRKATEEKRADNNAGT